MMPLDQPQIVCLATGAVVGALVTLAVVHLRAWLEWRRHQRAVRLGRILEATRP